jgi:hypothetical protein
VIGINPLPAGLPVIVLSAADLDSSEVLLLQRLLAGDTAGWEATRSLRA